MKNAHRRVISLAGAVLVVLIVCWFALQPKPETEAPAPVVPAPVPVAPPPTVEDGNRTSTRPDPSHRIVVSPDTAAGEAPVEHGLRGVIMANAEELALTPADVEQLVAQTLEFHEIHTEIIARFLKETTFDPQSVTLHVPPYPVEGKALRDLYHQRLKSSLSEEKFARVREHIGHYLDQSFRGFGIAAQTYTLVRSKEAPSSLELEWNIQVPEGTPPGGLNADMSYPGSSGKLLLTAEQIVTGEYRFLAPVLAHRFSEIPLNTQ